MPPAVSRAFFAPLDDAHVVFRVALVGKAYLPDDTQLPNDAFFALSDPDRHEAASRNQRALLSCWDVALTTRAQGESIRLRDQPEGARARSYALDVARIRAVGVEVGIPLDVLDDRHLPEDEGPGAEGHCGIVGLDREEKRGTKIAYKNARETLARSCRKME